MSNEQIIDSVPEHLVAHCEVIRGASRIALKKARMYGTKLVIMEEGELLYLDPDEFEARLSE